MMPPARHPPFSCHGRLRSIAGPVTRAFTFVELLAVVALVAILSAIAIPVYQHTTQSARAAACAVNLRQLGVALNLYLADHSQILPPLKAARASRAEDVPVLDNTLSPYVADPRVFVCPADTVGLAAKTGTSYFWNVALSNQPLLSLNFFLQTDKTLIPVFSDKQAFHPYTDTKVNILYADGHADQALNFAAGTPAP